MSGPKSIARLAVLAIGLTVLLCGCGYDYLQHTDRIAYRAGDAVSANLEGETVNPSKRSMYLTSGLGRNGLVTPPASPAPLAPTTSATP